MIETFIKLVIELFALTLLIIGCNYKRVNKVVINSKIFWVQLICISLALTILNVLWRW